MKYQYVLPDNSLSQNRLNLQHSLYESSSREFLLKAGLQKGMKVLEIGCGTGLMTLLLSHLVGTSGKITALDISRNYVAITKELCQGNENVEVLHKDLYGLGHFNTTFDLIYCRFVLHHLEKPEVALQNMIRCLRPNGIIACEEAPTHEGVFSYPDSDALRKLVSLITKCLQANKSKYEFAYQMEPLFEKHGLQIKLSQVLQPLISKKQQRLLHSMTLEDISAALVSTGLATQLEISELIKNLNLELMNAQCVSLYRTFQIAACKVNKN